MNKKETYWICSQYKTCKHFNSMPENCICNLYNDLYVRIDKRFGKTRTLLCLEDGDFKPFIPIAKIQIAIILALYKKVKK